MHYLKYTIILLAFSFFACNNENSTKEKAVETAQITFMELGSTRCIPCQKMEKVIEEVKKNYPKKVNTIFHDVWTKEKEHFADDYHIDAIPTQIFLDKNGKEFFRHEGFFPYEDLKKIIDAQLKK